MNVIRFSLTPGFSRVTCVEQSRQPFQRLFLRALQTVETVFVFPAIVPRAEARC